MFHDKAKIWVEAGRGGNGVISFRREAHVPRGGPDGGDGGRGGDVVLICDPSRRDLASLRMSPHYRAGKGGHGSGQQRHGARGNDREIPVPPGTTAAGVDGSSYDLVEPGQRAVVAVGGDGGHGNKRFTSSTRQAPRFAEAGIGGEEGWIELRLRLLADAGLVGAPNAGKSSLLARLTNARPKVADYPFTTLDPVLGTLDDGDRQLVIADIPGLIEGAADGAGLGHEFLAHVERCRALVHLVAIDPLDERELYERYRTIRSELRSYGAGLGDLPQIVAVSKRDLLPDAEVAELVDLLRDQLGNEAAAVLAISSATGQGIEDLLAAVFPLVPADSIPATTTESQAGYEAEHITYRPAGDQGFDVVRDDDGFRVQGRGIELLVERHDLTNYEALSYIEGRLRDIGVIAALERAGFEPGNEVRIGDQVFELDPP